MRTRWIPWTLCLATLVAPAGAAGPAPAPDPAAVLAQARARQAVAELGEAADGLELFVRLRPQAPEAPEALSDATVLRLGMGQDEQATKNADTYVKNYGATQPERAALVSFAVAEHAAEHEDHAAAQRRLTAWIAAYDRSAPLDLRLRAHALLGRAWTKLDQGKRAEPEYAAARDLWIDADAAVRTLRAEGGDDRRLAKALTAVGEARFFFAEKKKRSEVEAIHFPEYRAKGDKDGILGWMRTKVVDWVKKKRAAIESAERAYLEVVQIQPAPPPRWVIASGSRVGQMWGLFTAEFRAAPIPREWKGTGVVPGSTLTYHQLRAIYYGALDETSEPMKVRAKAAFTSCVDYSVKFQYADEYSRRCHEWLGKNYTAQHPPISEILPRFGLFGAAAPLPEPLPEPGPVAEAVPARAPSP